GVPRFPPPGLGLSPVQVGEWKSSRVCRVAPARSGNQLTGGHPDVLLDPERQFDPDGCSGALDALERDAAAVPLDDRLRDREPETGPRNRMLGRAGAPEETFEELCLLVLGDS